MSVESLASEQRYRLLYQAMPAAISVVELRPDGQLGRFLDVSDVACERLGYSRDEMVEMTPAEIAAPDPAFDAEAVMSRLRAGQHVTFERVHVARNGRRIPTEIHARVVDLGDRRVVLSVLQDITERTDALERLSESERRLRYALEGASDAAWELNITTGELWGSPSYYTMLGYEPGEFPVSFETWVELLHPDDREPTIASFREQIDARAPQNRIEFRMRAKDGSYRWVLGRSKAVERDASGLAVRLIGTNTDVTDRRIAEESLRGAMKLLQDVMDNSPAVIYATDAQGRFTLANRRLGEIWGVPPASIIGTTRDGRLPAEIAADHLANDLAVFRTRHTITLEEVNPEPDGLHTYLTTKAPVLDESGNVTSVLGVSTDITDAKKAEEMVRQVQKLESLGVLAGGVAHDFNNLLTVIIGNQSMAESLLPPGSPARESIEAAEKAAQRAAELARAMLLLSGHDRFLFAPVDLNALIAENTSLLQALLPGTVRLVATLGPGLPKVEADAGQLQRVIVNLVTNSGEAIGGRAGAVSIETGTEAIAGGSGARYDRFTVAPLPPGPYVFVQVRDDGEGMDAATQARIFEPFFSTRFTGRGLGLPIVRGIVRGHRGGIAVESAPGRGTLVRVVLPAVHAATQHRSGEDPSPHR